MNQDMTPREEDMNRHLEDASGNESATVPEDLDVIDQAVGALAELAVVDPEQIAQLDNEYRPFPAFAEWANATIDQDDWASKYAEFDGRRRQSSSESIAKAVEVALRAAAVDTGAIEGLYQVDPGFTVSVATMDPGWEQKVEAMGTTFQALFQSQLRAYELAQQLAASRTGLAEAWIRELHHELCKSQRTYQVVTAVGIQEHELPLGQYKHYPNHVRLPSGRFHAYAPVQNVPYEMGRLVSELRSDEFAKAHPVLQASYAHYAAVAVHPFADGNGRVARALASSFLCRAARIPLVVFADQKTDYRSSLAAADTGQWQPFVDFIFMRCIDSLDFVSDRLGASAQAQSKRLETILRGSGPFTPNEVDGMAKKLFELVRERIQHQGEQLSLPSGIQLGQGLTARPPDVKETDRYRIPDMQPYSSIVLSIVNRVPFVHVSTNIVPLSAHRSDEQYICAIINVGTGHTLEVRADELIPQPTSALRLKIDSWVERTLAELLADFGTNVAEAVHVRDR